MTEVVKSKRSGGPRTPAGKAATLRNSLKTGAYSSLVVLPGENESEFHELEQHLQSDFQVEGIVEAAMVHELAVLTWKRMRLERLEQKQIIAQLSNPIGISELRGHGMDAPKSVGAHISNLDQVADFDIESFRGFQSAAKRMLDGKNLLATLELHEKQNTWLFENLADEARTLGMKGPTAEILATVQLPVGAYKVPLIDNLLEKIIPKIQAILWVADHASEIAEAKAKIRDQRLLNLMQSKGLQRTYDDLSRSFFRVLAELRKHQSWRRKNKVIDVADELDDNKKSLG